MDGQQTRRATGANAAVIRHQSASVGGAWSGGLSEKVLVKGSAWRVTAAAATAQEKGVNKAVFLRLTDRRQAQIIAIHNATRTQRSDTVACHPLNISLALLRFEQATWGLAVEQNSHLQLSHEDIQLSVIQVQYIHQYVPKT